MRKKHKMYIEPTKNIETLLVVQKFSKRINKITYFLRVNWLLRVINCYLKILKISTICNGCVLKVSFFNLTFASRQ